MGKEKIISCTLVILITIPLFCFVCTWTTQKTSKGLVIRCPKCGAFCPLKEVDKTFDGCEESLRSSGGGPLSPLRGTLFLVF
jgi:DNA-directed RNA polymerase subunit RPC12/RpoP